jgi:hypothetical protein
MQNDEHSADCGLEEYDGNGTRSDTSYRAVLFKESLSCEDGHEVPTLSAGLVIYYCSLYA